MLSGSEDKAKSLQSLSALADGELDTAATKLACAHWRGDVDVRVSWHAYHLIGDVMRSDDLASDAARDTRFLHTLRERLAAEPALLAPQPVGALTPDPQEPSVRGGVRGLRGSWMALAAVAAGFMAVASVLVLTRGTTPFVGSAGSLARSLADKGAVLAEASTSAMDPPGDPQTFVANDKLVRDARLERYFAAHMQFGGSSALGVPSGFLRAATTQTSDR